MITATPEQPSLAFDSNIIVLKKDEADGMYKSKVTITNTVSEHMAVKVKCNAQNLYAIKSRAFVLEPLGSSNLKIVTKKDFVDVSVSVRLGS
jgi:hypothetical protein